MLKVNLNALLFHLCLQALLGLIAFKILGITVRSDLSMSDHVVSVCESAAQSLYAIKLLKSHGLDRQSAADVCKATVISRLTYASPAWWGFCNMSDKLRLQSIANRAIRWGYLDASQASVDHICNARDAKLFNRVLHNPSHVRHPLLPPPNSSQYNLRARGHNRQLPHKDSPFLDKNFFTWMLFKHAHCV